MEGQEGAESGDLRLGWENLYVVCIESVLLD